MADAQFRHLSTADAYLDLAPGTYQPGVEVNYREAEPEEANFITLRGPVDREGFGHADTHRHQFGPDWDDTLPEPRPAQNWIALTGFHDESGWSEEHLPGWKAVIADTASPHYGFQDEWGPDTSIPRSAPAPWDAGLIRASDRRVYGAI